MFCWTQEQVEQSVREKAELQKNLDQTMEENETLKRDLQKEQQEATSLKVFLSNLPDVWVIMNPFAICAIERNSQIGIELWYLTQCGLFLQEQNEQKEKEMSQLVKELDQTKEQNENLKSTLQQLLKETNIKVCFRSTCEI